MSLTGPDVLLVPQAHSAAIESALCLNKLEQQTQRALAVDTRLTNAHRWSASSESIWWESPVGQAVQAADMPGRRASQRSSGVPALG